MSFINNYSNHHIIGIVINYKPLSPPTGVQLAMSTHRCQNKVSRKENGLIKPSNKEEGVRNYRQLAWKGQ
jgi:hypothetical protein